MNTKLDRVRKTGLLLGVLLGVLGLGWLGWRVAAGGKVAAPHGGPNGLAAAINADGTLKAGVNGSFDTRGFRMEMTASGAPRFVAAQAGCDGWDTQFSFANGTNGSYIRAIALVGSDVYVGGDFTIAGNVAANRVARFNTMTNTWSALSSGTGNGVNSAVLALAVIGSDVYVGGTFTQADIGGTSINANRVAHFNIKTNTWSALGSGTGNGVNGGVNALAVTGSDLYVGGFFSQANIGGTIVSANHVAQFDTVTNSWNALISSAGNGVSGDVYALAASGSDVFVGGEFFGVNGGVTPISARRVARFNTTTNTWTALGSSSGNGLNDTVYALAVSGSDLYVGGAFGQANVGGTTVSVNFLARFNTTTNTWNALGASAGNGVSGFVRALMVSGSALYVGGSFNQANVGSTTISANGIACFNTTTNTWSAVNSGAGNGVSANVRALAVNGSNLYVGGDFDHANEGGTTVSANHVARFDMTTNIWSTLNTGNGVNGLVYALAVSGSDVYVGSSFTAAGNIAVNGVARFNTASNTWSTLGSGFGNGVNSNVRALAVIGSDVYVGGFFTQANVGGTIVSANRVARFNTTTNTWSALGDGGGNGVNNVVYAMAVSGSDLYVGGEFLQVNVGGTIVSANRVARFNTTTNTWSALGDGGGNGVNNRVHALAVSGSDLYVGGIFTQANAGGAIVSVRQVARFNTTTNTWSALGSGAGNGVNNNVYALVVDGSNLYVGGAFTQANAGGTTVTANRVVRFNTTTNTWSAVGSGAGNGVNNIVYALAVSGGELYVGGFFTQTNVGGTIISANSVSRFNTATNTWSALGEGVGNGNGVDDSVFTLAVGGSSLYLGGDFQLVESNKPSAYIGRFCSNTTLMISAVNQMRQQGSPTANAQIATVNDVNAGVLTVTATNIPTGISVTNIVNTGGVVTADVAATCAAALGGNTVVLTVTNGTTGQSAAANMTVNVTSNSAPNLAYPASVNVTAGNATMVSAATATDNGLITGFGIVSVVPPLSIAPIVNSSGVVSITNAGPSGNHTITVQATDNCGAATNASFTLIVDCQTVTINQSNLPNGFVGTAYNQTLTATGGTAPYSFTVSDGALPNGITLSTGGVLTGTPTIDATFSFTARATDANNCFGERQYMLTINPAGIGLQFYPLSSPMRLLDTRPGGSANACSQPDAPITGGTSRIQPARSFCGIPATAAAITGNVTTVASGGGFLTLYPSGATQPTVASTNYSVNEAINNVFTVGLGTADGAFNIFALTNTDVVVDVTGYYAPPATGGLYFHLLPSPVRLLETRAGQAIGCVLPGAPLTGGADSLQTATTACTGIPAQARAIVGNATTVSPQGGGFLTLFPADATRPLVASSNYNFNQVVNEPFTVGLSATGQFKIFTLATTDLVVDVLGYYSTEAVDANGAGLLFTPLTRPVRLLETRSNPPNLTGCFKLNAPLNGAQAYTQTARGLCDGLTIPANALGVVGNATVVIPLGGGFLTLWPTTAATQPSVATANYNTGQVVNRHFIVGLGSGDGAFKLFSLATTELVIDLSGYFAP